MQLIENSGHQDEGPKDKPLDLRAGKGAGSSHGMSGLKPCLCGTPQKKTDSLQPNIRLDSYEVQGTHHPPQTQGFHGSSAQSTTALFIPGEASQ